MNTLKPQIRRIHMCECGNIGAHQYGSDWECDRCHRLRLEYCHESRKYVQARAGGNARHVQSVRQLQEP